MEILGRLPSEGRSDRLLSTSSQSSDNASVTSALVTALIQSNHRVTAASTRNAFGPEQLLDVVPAGVFACDATGRVTFTNRRATELLAAGSLSAPSEILFADWRKAGSPDGPCDGRDCDFPIGAIIQAGRPLRDCEVYSERSDGTRIHVSINLDILHDANGSISGAIGVLHDVTARKAAERHVVFLERLCQSVTALLDPEEIMQRAARAVGVHLGVQRCAFVESKDHSHEILVRNGFSAAGVTDIAGTYDFATHGLVSWRQRAQQENLAVNDIEIAADASDSLPAMRALQIRAFASARFLRRGNTAVSLAVATDRPRLWVPDELDLLERIVFRIFPLIERARAEMRARDSEAELRLISANAPVLLSHWGRDRRLLFASRAFSERWKVAPETLYGKTVAEILGPEAFESLKGYIDEVMAGESVAFEMEVPYRDIGVRYVQASYSPDLGPDGAVRGFFAAVVDLTDRRRMEVALGRSEERLRMATRAGKIGLWDWDIEKNHVTWTDSLYEIHGIAADAFDGTLEAFASLVHSEDRAPVRRAIDSALEHDARYELEFRAVRSNGVIIWLFANGFVVREAGRAVRMVGATVDITARKTAELALRESESRFRLLASHAPVGIFLTDAKGECIFVNEAMRTMAGLPVEKMRGSGWQNALHPDDRRRVADEWSRFVRERQPFSSEYRFLRPDGTIVWLQASAVESRSAGGALHGHIGTVSDVTKRKEGEDKLRIRESQLRLISTDAPIILAHCDREERFLFVNRAYAARLHLTPEQIIGRTMADVIGNEARSVLAPYIKRVLAGERVEFEIEIPYRDIGRRFMRVTYAPDLEADGGVSGWLAAISDVTDRRLMEDALRDSEERFRMLADNIAQIAWTADANNRLDWYNQRFYEFSGFTREQALAGEGVKLNHPDHLARVREKFERQFAAGEAWEDVFPLRNREGEYRWFLSRAIPIRNAAGTVVRWFGTNTDVTELRAAEDALRRAQDQLQAHAVDLENTVAERTQSLRAAIAQMEEFSYSVSHDLRAPLRAMNAYAEALIEDYGERLDDTANDYLRRIQRSSQRMQNLTRDVLTYSRVAQTEVDLTTVNLENVLRDLIEQYSELQPPKTDLVITEPLHSVRGNESWLGQCLANLLTNAAKFVDPGVQPRIHVWSERVGQHVRVWVEDNGVGIPAEHHARLFQVFERVPTPREYEGTGIGLAIVRKATEKMNGCCGFESNAPGGSRFWIELPKA